MTSEEFIDLRSAVATGTVPAFPTVVATVREDGTGEVMISGASYSVTEADMPSARAATIDLIVENAASRVKRPLRVEISDPAGAWVLAVHPDGRVEELEMLPSADRVKGTHTGELPVVRDLSLVHAAEEPADDTPHPVADDDPLVPHDGEARRESFPLDGPEVPPRPPTAFPVTLVPTAPAAPSVSPSAATSVTGAAHEQEDAVRPPPSTAPATRRKARQAPTLTDLIATRPEPQDGPAQLGWQASVRRLTGGLLTPAPSPREQAQRRQVAVVQKPLAGPKTVVVINPKGGGTKTTSAFLLAATFGRHRGGYTLAWDNNETRGTLGWRSQSGGHERTAVDLLRDLDRFGDGTRSRVGDLDDYVRSQGQAQFDVLASDEDAASAASIDGEAFARLHGTLSRFYRVIVVDTGNNMRASNWSAAVEAADQLVIVSTVREDTAQSAAWLIDALRATGREQAVEEAVTVLTAPARTVDPGLRTRLHRHFGQLTRAVLEVPHDESLVSGGPIRYEALSQPTRDAWLSVSATVAEGL